MKSTRPRSGVPRLRLLLPALAAAGFAAVAGCERAPARPDILLVTIDTLRADHCSSYGYPIPTTPNLDRLAGRGLLYRRAYAESSTTAPSHAVLMTGRHFRSLGVTKNAAIVPPQVVTLAERLRDAGYATAAFVSSYPLMSRFGFEQGFDTYDDEFATDEASLKRRKPGRVAHDRLAGATTRHVESWLTRFARNEKEKPLFLWVHFVDPHAPYRSPEKLEASWPEGTRRSIPRYDSEVRYADANLGRVLDLFAALHAGREQLVVVTSDHGEGLGDHQWMSHGINLHEEAVRIPLVASWPGRLPEGRVVEEPVGLVDIASGILDLLEIEAKEFSDGVPLFGPLDESRAIFLQRRDFKTTHERGRKISGDMTAVVEKGSKLIVAPGEDRRELYDLDSDPKELRDLLAPAPSGEASGTTAAASAAPAEREGRADALETEIEAWKKAFPAVPLNEAAPDKETLRALRSLGYVD